MSVVHAKRELCSWLGDVHAAPGRRRAGAALIHLRTTPDPLHPVPAAGKRVWEEVCATTIAAFSRRRRFGGPFTAISKATAASKLPP